MIILLLFALVLAILAALNVPSGRVSFGWASISFYFLYLLVTAFPHIF